MRLDLNVDGRDYFFPRSRCEARDTKHNFEYDQSTMQFRWGKGCLELAQRLQE